MMRGGDEVCQLLNVGRIGTHFLHTTSIPCLDPHRYMGTMQKKDEPGGRCY
jgi:hypothetical protein